MIVQDNRAMIIAVIFVAILFITGVTLAYANGVNSTYAKLYKIEHPEVLLGRDY